MKSKLMLGAISYLKSDMLFFEDRVSFHEAQLRMWETFDPVPFYRTEIFWDEETETRLTTSMDLHSIKVKEPCFVGGARNKLLQVLYTSDYDYLICCDDDCLLDPVAECFDFIRQLTPRQAENQELIAFTPETFLSKEQLNSRVRERQTKSGYLLSPSLCTQGLAISCIPNLVKYGKEPLWFHEKNTADVITPSEDSVFLVDWISRKYPVYDTRILFSYPQDRSLKSAVFGKSSNRNNHSRSRAEALNTYIQERFPGRPDIYNARTMATKKNTAKRRNVFSTIPRQKILFETL